MFKGPKLSCYVDLLIMYSGVCRCMYLQIYIHREAMFDGVYTFKHECILYWIFGYLRRLGGMGFVELLVQGSGLLVSRSWSWR